MRQFYYASRRCNRQLKIWFLPFRPLCNCIVYTVNDRIVAMIAGRGAIFQFLPDAGEERIYVRSKLPDSRAKFPRI